MNHEFSEEFSKLREEFNLLKNGIRTKSMLEAQVMNNVLLPPALLPVSRGDPETYIPSGSASVQSSRFKPSETSYISTEIEMTPLDELRIINPAVPNKSGTPFQDRAECISATNGTSLGESPLLRNSRRGHRKSRDGCFNCKRRKIKCQETQPVCQNCTKRNITCSYPAPRTLKALQGSLLYSSSPIGSVKLQDTPTIFSLTDMRLFHHFLTDAYPHLPVGKDNVWLSQIPLIAHHNEYLMHAILGMSASHLELLTGVSAGTAAVQHRLLAIQGSKAASLRKISNGSSGDALLGSCYLLAFQSSCMKDGILEFFTMVRGCSLLSDQLRKEKLPMVFFLTEKDHFQIMEERLLDLPVISPELVEGTKQSLAAVKPLCNLPSEIEFYQLLDDCIGAIKISSLQAYFKFIYIFQSIVQMDLGTFENLMDPRNIVARILIAHFFALQLVVTPILNREWAGRKKSTPLRNHLGQIYLLSNEVPDTFVQYLEWPLLIADTVRDELLGKEIQVPGISVLQQKDRTVAILSRPRK